MLKKQHVLLTCVVIFFLGLAGLSGVQEPLPTSEKLVGTPTISEPQRAEPDNRQQQRQRRTSEAHTSSRPIAAVRGKATQVASTDVGGEPDVNTGTPERVGVDDGSMFRGEWPLPRPLPSTSPLNATREEKTIFALQSLQAVGQTVWRPNMEGTVHQASNFFESHYKKIHCGAIVSNVCFEGVQPVYFNTAQNGKFFTGTGTTTICNEGGAKQKLHMIMKSSGPRLKHPPEWAPAAKLTEKAASISSLSFRDAQLLPYVVVPFCWETYGYHLILCLMATHAHLLKLGLLENVRRSGLFAVYKGISFPFQFGSSAQWTSGSGSALKDVKDSNYWELWRVLADDPAQVMGLAHIPQRCYGLGIYGGQPSPTLTPLDAQRFKYDVWHRLRLHPPSMRLPAKQCTKGHDEAVLIRVVIVQRKTRFTIKNVDEMKTAWVKAGVAFGEGNSNHHPTVKVDVEVVHLEELSLREQLQIAIEADVISGVHGNGLTWVSLARPGTVVVELWPNQPYNANYATMAQKSNVLHMNVAGDGQCKQRCAASYNVQEAAAKSLVHLWSVKCEGVAFDTMTTFVSQQEDHLKRKEQKRKQKQAH